MNKNEKIERNRKLTYRLFTAAIFVFYVTFGMIAAELVRVSYHSHSWLLFGMVVFGWLALCLNWLLKEMKKEDEKE
jgi:predicted tellurium resistance membrane protein TerC